MQHLFHIVRVVFDGLPDTERKLDAFRVYEVLIPAPAATEEEALERQKVVLHIVGVTYRGGEVSWSMHDPEVGSWVKAILEDASPGVTSTRSSQIADLEQLSLRPEEIHVHASSHVTLRHALVELNNLLGTSLAGTDAAVVVSLHLEERTAPLEEDEEAVLLPSRRGRRLGMQVHATAAWVFRIPEGPPTRIDVEFAAGATGFLRFLDGSQGKLEVTPRHPLGKGQRVEMRVLPPP